METSETTKTTKLIFKRSKDNPSEFKFLNLVEDTIIGIFGFIERLLRTIFLFVFKPIAFTKQVSLPYTESVLIGSYTFLTITTFLFNLSIKYGIVSSFTSNESGLVEKLENTTYQSLFWETFIPLIGLVFFSLLIAQLFHKLLKVSRLYFMNLNNYCFGFLFLFLNLLFVFNFSISKLDIESDVVLLTLKYLTPFVILMIFLFTNRPIFLHFTISNSKIVNRIIRYTLGLVLAISVFFCNIYVTLFADTTLNWSIVDKQYDELKLKVWNSELEIKYQTANLILVIKNTSKREVFIKQSDIVLAMRYPEKRGHVKIETTVKNSQDDKDILHLKQEESKWISIKYPLSEEDIELIKSNDFHNLRLSYITLTAIDPISYSKGFLDFREHQFEKILNVSVNGKLFP